MTTTNVRECVWFDFPRVLCKYATMPYALPFVVMHLWDITHVDTHTRKIHNDAERAGGTRIYFYVIPELRICSLSLSLSAYFSVQNFAILSCIVARFQLLSCVWSCIFRRHFVCVFVFLFKCFKSIYSCIKISALSSRIMPWNWPSNKFWWCQSMVLHNISHKHTQHMSIVLYVGYERWFSFSPEYQIIPFVWIFWLYSYNSQNGQGRSIRSDCLCSFPVHSICLWWRGIATWTIHNA